ncbi:MAG: tellurite resistance TerB family protein [Pirellulaceae bacterium]
MTNLRQLHSQLLTDGRITLAEVDTIRDAIASDSRLDLEDVKFLVELRSEACSVCPEFDQLFFPILKQVLLEDGRIGLDEQYYLLKMLYADGHVTDRERQFLHELRGELPHVSREFEALCETAVAAPETDWDLGGR